MRTIERMVEQEIICNVSHLIYVLNQGVFRTGDDLESLCTQAAHLAAPVDDWEEAALQEGWQTCEHEHYGRAFWNRHTEVTQDEPFCCESWEDLCRDVGIEPYAREVFEHWFVTDWFADRLAAKGEKVDKDFAGHCVCGRGRRPGRASPPIPSSRRSTPISSGSTANDSHTRIRRRNAGVPHVPRNARHRPGVTIERTNQMLCIIKARGVRRPGVWSEVGRTKNDMDAACNLARAVYAQGYVVRIDVLRAPL